MEPISESEAPSLSEEDSSADHHRIVNGALNGQALTEAGTTPRSAGSRRFISDLKAESTFLTRTPALSNSDRRQSLKHNEDIGVWVDKREWVRIC